MPLRTISWSVLLLGLVISAASAQPASEPAADSRSGTIAAQQQEKSTKLNPPQPDKVEKYILRAEKLLLETPSGFYPAFSSVYHGGGLTLGAGYRRYYADDTSWNIMGLYSFKNYKLLEVGTESRGHLEKRLSFGGKFGWRDATQVGYFGTGMKTDVDNRANFRFQETYADGHAVLRPVRWFPIQGSVGVERWETMQGQGSFPSIETKYTAQTAPGLGASPVFIHSQLSAGFDWRQSEGYTTGGGLYQATFHDYRSDSNGLYNFQRLDADVIQHVPLLRDTWVLAVRGRLVTTLNDNNLIPYFMLPALGDGSSLRAFTTDRFRDRHSMLMTAEFRWLPAKAVDMALFYDAGKVTPHRRDLDFTNLKSDVGIGIRFHGTVMTPLRIDLAYGNEGIKLVFSSSAVF